MRRALVILLGALLLSACPGGGGSGKASGKPTSGGTFRMAIERPTSLDPARASTVEGGMLADQLFDSLTAFDPTTLAVVPAIAASWSATPDQRHWDFVLNPNVKFSNGRQITSADVKYSIERVVRRDTQASTAFLLEPITGYTALNDAKGTATDLAGVTIPRPDLVHFDLDTPLSTLPALLGNITFAIVAREAVEAKPPSPEFAREPVSSGPFHIQSRTDSVLHLVAGPNGPKPHVAAVDVHLYSDRSAAYAAFNRKSVDWTLVPPSQVDEAADRHGRSGFRPYATVGFWGFNLKSPKFADIRFREAIVAAIDRQAIARGIYSGNVTAANRLIPEGIPGAQADPCGEQCDFNPNKARALIKDAFPTTPPPEIFIDYDQDTTQEAIAKAIQNNLKDVGVTATLRPHPYADYVNFALGQQPELFRLGWGGLLAYPRSDSFLSPLFLTGSHENVTQFSNAQVDALLNQGRSDPSEAKQIAVDQDAEKLILDQFPIVPVFQTETHSVSAARVKGVQITAFGSFDATQVWLTEGPGVKK